MTKDVSKDEDPKKRLYILRVPDERTKKLKPPSSHGTLK